MSDVGGEFVENCGFEGKILCEVPQPCAPCDSRDTPATGYTPPEGWRLLEVGEPLQNGDQWITESGAVEVLCGVQTEIAQRNGHYIRQIQPEVVQSVQVREGRWRTRGGDIRNVTPTPAGDGREHRFPWWDAQYRQTWAEDGRYHVRGESPLDLDQYLGPIEQQTEPQSEPEAEPEPSMLQDADHENKLLEQANHNLAGTIGRLQARSNELEKLVTDLRAINESQEKAVRAAGRQNTDLQHRLDVVSAEWAEQAETIRRLQARIFDLETINQAMEKAVNDAGNANNKLRTQAEEFRFEISYLQNLLGEERAKQADKLAQFEALQPIAAACHTAQTMVRDMLGHMRCLLALQHTTDRRDSCTLLESILEVFDDAECDEDEDDDTTCTSEAGQG